jgi:hypothetical protein
MIVKSRNGSEVKLMMKRIPLTLIGLLSLLIGFSAVAAAQVEEDATTCTPFAYRLAQVADEPCQTFMDLHGEGIGFGQMMMAWRLSQAYTDESVTWQEILAERTEETGWGQIIFAHRFAAALDDPEISAGDLLALKQDGLGWGQIRQAQAIAAADLGLSFAEATALIQEGKGWGEIRAELGLEGPPPWSGGPPPWAGPKPKPGGQGGNDESPGSAGGGPPSWAGGPGGPNERGGPPPGKGKNK